MESVHEDEAVDRHVDERMGGSERGRNPEHERDVGRRTDSTT